MEAQVRAMIGTILVIGTVAISSVQAQTYDPRYPAHATKKASQRANQRPKP
jgi:hypothetical protein